MNENFTIRFLSSKKNSASFNNTILSIKKLKNYDNKPFIACLITPTKNYLFLANSTLLEKVSHSSKRLEINNLVGSFNGSNILRELNGINNKPANFKKLYEYHMNIGFNGNIERLVNNTKGIKGNSEYYIPSSKELEKIVQAYKRTIDFMDSEFYKHLQSELDNKVNQNTEDILALGNINNVNLRGREIENLISNQDSQCDGLTTSNDLSDYDAVYPGYKVSVDIKSKMLDKNSSPKGYNIDKMLKFLGEEGSVYFIYLVGIDENKVYTRLVSMFDKEILNNIRIVDSWSGQNSRGTTQYDGNNLKKILKKDKYSSSINKLESLNFIKTLINCK